MSTGLRTRNYDNVLAKLTPPTSAPESSREDRMQRVVDALWDELHDKGVSWVGFYLKPMGMDEMVLGPRRDKPACSPIGMFGACGRCYISQRPLIVTDVTNLRAGYIACDPRDRSECVVPLFDGPASCYGVLDLDSHDTYAFTRDDVYAVQRILQHVGLTLDSYGSIDTV